MQKLKDYFTSGITSRTLQTVGTEIETQFLYGDGKPITVDLSQQILNLLVRNGDWKIEVKKDDLITSIVDLSGNKIFYELGRHNMEVATIARAPNRALDIAQSCLGQLYDAACSVGAYPCFKPVLQGDEDLLVVPDERDSVWVELDGRKALAPLARTSSVHITFSVSAEDAIRIINTFGQNIDSFLSDFPQDTIWRDYIKRSSAGYLPDRYGGPLLFSGIDEYCESHIRQNVVQGVHLVPFEHVRSLDIPLYIRSVWWYFRLKRYGNDLCLEIRPCARRVDHHFKNQLERVLSMV